MAGAHFRARLGWEHRDPRAKNESTKESQQAPVDEPWAQKVKQLFPLKINRFAVHNGELHYRDFSRQPKVDLTVDRVQMVAVNLTNSKSFPRV